MSVPDVCSAQWKGETCLQVLWQSSIRIVRYAPHPSSCSLQTSRMTGAVQLWNNHYLNSCSLQTPRMACAVQSWNKSSSSHILFSSDSSLDQFDQSCDYSAATGLPLVNVCMNSLLCTSVEAMVLSQEGVIYSIMMHRMCTCGLWCRMHTLQPRPLL